MLSAHNLTHAAAIIMRLARAVWLVYCRLACVQVKSLLLLLPPAVAALLPSVAGSSSHARVL
jgi:hypothetical protein